VCISSATLHDSFNWVVLSKVQRPTQHSIGHFGVSSVLRPHQHSIGYTGDGFYRSKDPSNSIKVLKEMLQNTKKTTKTT